MQVRPADREDHEGSFGQLTKSPIDVRHRRRVAPVSVLEDQEDGTPAAHARDEIRPGGAHLVAHDDRVAAGGAEREARSVVEGHGGELADELRDPPHLAGGDSLRDEILELVPADGDRLEVDDLRRAPHRGGEQDERRPGVHRIAPALEHARAVGAFVHALDELVTDSRFAEPRRGREEHGPGSGVFDALVERAEDRGDLLVPADARGRLSEQQARRARSGALLEELAPCRSARDLEAAVDEAGRDVVDSNPRGRGRRCAEEPDRAIDDFPEAAVSAELGAPRREGDGKLGGGASHGERASRGVRRPVGGARLALEDGDDRGPEELDPGPEHRRRGQELLAIEGRRVERLGSRRLPDRERVGHLHGDDAEEPLLAAGQGRRGGRGERRRGGVEIESLDGVELGRDRRAVARPSVRVFREHPRKQVLERPRRVRDVPRQRGDVLEQDLREDRGEVVAPERNLPGKALEEDAPEREDVGPRVDVLAGGRLLGREVAHGAEQDARGRLRALAPRELRHAEVEDLDARGRPARQEEVPRLDVAVHHALRVGGPQPLRDDPGQDDALAQGQAAAGEPRGQVFALEPFHGDVGFSVESGPVSDVFDNRRVP